MHRTQIYFDEPLYEEIKKEAARQGLSMSAYIRQTLKKDLIRRKRVCIKSDIRKFSGLWGDREVDVSRLRKRAWR